MNLIHNYNDFVNEARQLKHNYRFRDGDVVIATSDINADDLNFKRTAKSWVGRNVATTNNFLKEKGNYFKKGDVLMISVNKDNVYIGGKSGPEDDAPNSVSSFTINPNYDEDFRNQMTQIALNDGRAKIIRYDEMSEEWRSNFEKQVKSNKVWDSVNNKNSCTMEVDGEDLEVLKIVFYGNRFIDFFSSVKIDVVKHRKKETYYLSQREFDTVTFKDNGEVIDGNPFEGFTSSYAPGGYRKGKADGHIQH